MSSTLKTKAIAAVGWSSIEAFSRLGIQFVISIFLARLLAPEEFGTLAMILLFTAVATVFIDSGFGSALIQKREVSQTDSSSIFFFNLAMGATMGLLLCGVSPWIATFFKTPVLAPLTRLMALNLFITSFGSVHNALLSRELDFRTQTRITASASGVSGILAVILAWHGWGVWSLAFQVLTSTIISTTLLWALRPWRPSLTFQLTALRSMARFGGYLFAAGLLETLYNRFYTLLIGRLYSARDLGYFTRADTTQQMPAQLLSSVVNRVMYPVFSSVATDNDRLHRGARKVIMNLMLVNVPIMLGLMAVSHSLVLVLFGPKWLPCVPYLRILCLSGLLWPLQVVNLSVLKSMGRSDLFLRVEVVKKVLCFSALIATVLVSVLAMTWSRVFLSIVCFGINAHYVGVLLAYPPARQFLDVSPCMAAGVIMMTVVWLLGLLLPLPAPALLGIQGLAGIIIYTILCVLFRIVVFRDVVRQARSVISEWRSSPAL